MAKKIKKISTQKGICVDILGESDPFSANGKSTGYRLLINGQSYLIDCGAPLFQTLPSEEINQIKGVFATHSHEDHKRWFTDLALYNFYCMGGKNPLRLITRHLIHEEYHKTSRAAIERTLSLDSEKVIEIPYERFVNKVFIGSVPKYRIGPYNKPGEEGIVWRVFDERDRLVPPQKAKIIVHPEANRPRMLLHDSKIKKWVEPESFYPLGDPRFYSGANDYYDEKGGFKVEAFKTWHGPPSTAFRVSTANESIFFSADSIYNPELWERLCRKTHKIELGTMSANKFAEAHVIYGDINNFIERTWSRERCDRALHAYNGAAILFHEVAKVNSVVHTDYPVIANAGLKNLIYTHTPDKMVTLDPMVRTGMRLRVIGKKYYEEVGDKLWHFNADCYIKDDSRCFVGYEKRNGKFNVVEEKNGLLSIHEFGEKVDGKILKRIDLLQDINGEYYPLLDNGEDYLARPRRGRIERVTHTKKGSVGHIVRNKRKGLYSEIES